MARASRLIAITVCCGLFALAHAVVLKPSPKPSPPKPSPPKPSPRPSPPKPAPPKPSPKPSPPKPAPPKPSPKPSPPKPSPKPSPPKPSPPKPSPPKPSPPRPSVKPPPPPKPPALITCIYAATSNPNVATVDPTQLAGTFPACANATFDVLVPSQSNLLVKVQAWFQVPTAPATGCGPACCQAAAQDIAAVVAAQAKALGADGIVTLTSKSCCSGSNNCNYFPVAGRKLMAGAAADVAPEARALREAGIDLFAGLSAPLL